MEITNEIEEQIINMGVFGYSASKIANILSFNVQEVENELADENSQLNRLLKKGRDLSDYVIDLKLFNMAKAGDIKALEKLEKRKNIRNY